ncbi:MAG: hypothetical protein P8P48_01155 [Saprospiraceae bacterium]|nr:hypothetical protein [Saprospiraceae bacterium]
MLKSIKNLCVVVLFLLSALSVDAQSKMEYNVFAGISGGEGLSNGSGFIFTANPTFNVSENFKVESRLGYTITKADETFLQGEFGQKDYVLFQVGPRYVFRSADKKFRPAISVLGGYHNLLTNSGTAFERDESDYSFSVNLDAEVSSFIFGISLESIGDTSIFLKVGFSF